MAVGFQTIKSWDQVTPFAGKIVAYETDSQYFGAERGYTIKNVHFGYISEQPTEWSDGDKGYKMSRVLKPKEVFGACALSFDRLRSGISMRLATPNEMQLIRRAISANQAKVEYFDKDKVTTILKRHLSKL